MRYLIIRINKTANNYDFELIDKLITYSIAFICALYIYNIMYIILRMISSMDDANIYD